VTDAQAAARAPRAPRSLRGRWLNAFLGAYRRRLRRRVWLDAASALRAARTTAERTRYAFLITVGTDGAPTARLVEPILQPGEDFVFWIGTGPGLRKVRELRADPRVTLAFGHAGEHANLVVRGTASVWDDPALRRRWWKPAWRLFFPDGPLGDDYVVVRVIPERMELMSFRRRIVPEPFGLRPLVLERVDGAWAVAPPDVPAGAPCLGAAAV
jgi:general stress protein 26